MKINYSNIVRQLLVVIAVVCALVMAILTVQSLARLLRPQTGNNEAVAGKPQPQAVSLPAAHEHSAPIPAIPLAPATPARPAPAATTQDVHITPDFQTIAQREQDRRKTIENMRKSARENPEADTLRQEKELQKIESSGNSFM